MPPLPFSTDESAERLTSLPRVAQQTQGSIGAETLLPLLPPTAPRAVRGRSKTKSWAERARGQWCWLRDSWPGRRIPRAAHFGASAGKCSMQGNTVKTEVRGHTRGRDQWASFGSPSDLPGVIHRHLPSRLSCPPLSAPMCMHTHTHTTALGGPAPTLRHPT